MKYLKTTLSVLVATLAGLVIFALVPFILLYRLVNRFAVAKPDYTDIYAPYYAQLNPYGSAEEWANSKESAPPSAVNLYAVHQAYQAISGNGFAHFFEGAMGILAPEAAKGFAEIGMDDVAALIHSAMARLGTPFPHNREARQNIVKLEDGALLKFEETSKFKALTGNPKKFGGAPRYYAFANAYAAKHRPNQP